MKSPAAWAFAQRCFSKSFLKWGGVLLLPSAALAAGSCLLEENTQTLVCFVLVFIQLAVMLTAILPVEKALKQQFDEEGAPREERIP